MKLKKGVKIMGIKPEIAFVMPIIDGVVNIYDKVEGCVITSACDSKHGVGSRHYIGLGIDVRTRNMTEPQQQYCATDLNDRLGEDFDVVLEKDHIHIEFDPKY